jgi:hypothetical protein
MLAVKPRRTRRVPRHRCTCTAKHGRLFTFGNPKTAKGESLGYLTAVLHLSPHESGGAGVNVCPFATPGCIATCLNTAGRGGIGLDKFGLNAIQRARRRKTVALVEDRATFLEWVRCEIRRALLMARRTGLKLCVRLNGTSDLPLTLAREFPQTQFYDYSKVPATLQRAATHNLPTNYHVTFSRSESNARDVFQALSAGVNVAVVFSTKRGQPLPPTYLGRTVIDGDTHDLRFLDPKGVVVGLRAKGRAKRDCSGFVVEV